MLNFIQKWASRAWLVLAIAAVILVLDQWTKELIRQSIPDYTSIIPIPALGEYFVFEHVHNYGAAFGILQNQSNLFAVIAGGVAVAMLAYVYHLPPSARMVRVLLGLILGGALGNLIDRLNQGYVTDFVKMGIPGVYYWPNYNIADSAIVVGVIAMGLYVVLDDLRKQRQQASAVAERS
ncbi:MAG: signal peptidase II [Caldilinea sp.]|jgi:signal peptidase II